MQMNLQNALDTSDKLLALGCFRDGIWEKDHGGPTPEEISIS